MHARAPAAVAILCVSACGSSGDGTTPSSNDGGVVDDTASDAPVTSSTLEHARDPITIDGAQLPRLLGKDPAHVVAYAWDGANFHSVPVQIDERAVRPFSDALSTSDRRRADTGDWTRSFYTNSNAAPGGGLTFLGVDSDPKLDADDELVVMAADFGGAAPDGSAPPGTDASTRVALHASDANDTSRAGWLYLFIADAIPTLDTARVSMDVRFVGTTDPFTTFFDSSKSAATGGTPRGCGDPKGWGVIFPEDTTVHAASYERHFSGRWLSDVIRVSNAGTLGPDLLDVHEARPVWPAFAGATNATTATIDATNNRTCTRSVTSFSGGPGTISTLRNGPVRVIRSYFGSNSGTINERTHFFYPEREDIHTFVRVHPIPGISDGLDLSDAARGMTYFNENNVTGLPIDGKPDTFDRRFARWEMVTGAGHDTLLSVHRPPRIELGAASASYAPEMFFIDDEAKPACICSGDDEMIGAHGIEVRADGVALPNTDPRLPDPGVLTMVRALYTLPGVTDVATATRYADEAFALRVSVDGAAAIDPFAVTCGDLVCEGDETSVDCATDCPKPAGADVCGDAKCGGYEQFICLADCKTGHQSWFECASASCATQYVPCVGDPSCKDALTALAACSSTYTSCATTVGGGIDDTFGRSLFTSLAGGCGKSACEGSF